MGGLKPSGKPFEISKQEVVEAYRKVAANKGAPGVDEVTLAEFESDLTNNLYKIWNRMASGSYFPPPVKAVEIPKPQGGIRVLGVPRYRRQSRPDRGGGPAGGTGGARLPPGLLRVPAGTVGAGGGGGLPGALPGRRTG